MHTFTNRLVDQTSPYLLQHAHNPVNWYPWGDEALELAKTEDKPMLVSIGYSACHWCHVMERESFENEATAAIMNEHFINIKIDREERPDIDHIYMDAVQAMTGSGGWPLNVFLLPDGRPFFGGTYFPPVRAYNRSSWQETLLSVNQAYKERKNELESQAENLTKHIDNANNLGFVNTSEQVTYNRQTEALIAQNLLKQADTTWGGFGKAPKFPQTFSIIYLLRYYHYSKDQAALNQALLSLDKMIYGGLYDHLGGGFARYSTDEKWLAPHFEKMLYDNALLIQALSEAFQLTQNILYSNTIKQTLDFIERELLGEEGGFLSALDADSEGVEGKFYTWSKSEIDEILKDDSELFCKFYNVTDEGNWEHTNILWVTTPLEDFIKNEISNEADGADFAAYGDKFRMLKERLFEHRTQRIRPGTDDKILLSWNALMNAAYCKAFAALSDEQYRTTAVKNMQFLEKRFKDPASNQWFHTYKSGIAKYPAFLEDYSYLIQAYIQLQEITGNAGYLLKARDIAFYVTENFKSENDPYFYFTHKNQNDVIIRKKEVYDGATPSGNSVMALNLVYLSKVFDKSEWFNLAEKMISGIQQAAVKYPTSFGVWASGILGLSEPVNEIAIVGKDADAKGDELVCNYIPNKVLQRSVSANPDFPLLANKGETEGVNFYLCVNYSCLQPVSTVSDLMELIK